MAIIIDSLVYKYPKSSFALDLNRLELKDNVTAIIGSNGAGKSTLFKCLEGFLKPQSGVIHKPCNDSEKIFRSAQVFQTEQCFEHITVREWIQFHALLKRIPITNEDIATYLKQSDLLDEKTHLVVKLSGGQQRRLNLVCALIGCPDLLILDEPTNGLDQEARKDYWSTIFQYKNSCKSSIVFSSHFMDEVQHNADYIYMLKAGKIIEQGTPAELISRLKLDYVALVDSMRLPEFGSFSGYERFEDSGITTIYIPDAQSFFAHYGEVEHLIRTGFAFRQPDLSDVYTYFYKEVL